MMHRCPASPFVIAAASLSAALCGSLPSGFRAGYIAENQHCENLPASESRDQVSEPPPSTPSIALFFWLKLRLVTDVRRSVYA